MTVLIEYDNTHKSTVMQLEKSIIFNLNKNLNLQLYLPNAIQFIEHVGWLRTKTSGKWHGPDKNINFCLA